MSSFEQLSLARRHAFCDNAAAQLGLPARSIEKDFWICWTLRELFELPDVGQTLTFKGGTSLSKAWQLIQRLSEDIDVVIDRRSLGFSPENGPEAVAISGNEREKRLKALAEAARKHVAEVLLPSIAERVSSQLPDGRQWRVELDPDDTDGQTILLHYPTDFTEPGYVRSAVKIELGARSDTDPTELVRIESYLSQALPGTIEGTPFEVRVVAPERTFLEKAMLLHEENFRAPGRELKDRLSRHYYDLACLIERGVAERATRNDELFTLVAAHRRVFFARNKIAHGSMRRGTLQLVPNAERRGAWSKDYEAMRETMFFVEPPPFDQIIESVRAFEARFNEGAT